MSIFDFIILGLVAGIPGACVQMYLYKRERSRQRNSPLWLAWSELQSELAATLHKPHPEAQEMDKLLEKLETFTLSGVSTISDLERARLTTLLREKVDDPNQTKEDRVRSEFMLFAMPRARREHQ